MRPRLFRSLVGLLAPLLICTAGLADIRKLDGPGVSISWDSGQMPDGAWSVGMGGISWPLPSIGDDGQWTFTGGTGQGEPMVLSLHPPAGKSALGPITVHLDFGPPQLLQLSGQTYLRASLGAGATYIRSGSLLTAPADSQLTVSSGQHRLDVTDGSSQHASASSGPLQATPAGLANELQVGAPGGAWVLTPQGGLDLTLSEAVIGSYHLTTSPDPLCESLACMVGQRASASLLGISIVIPVSYDFYVASSVPEPQTWTLLLAGGLLAGLRLQRRRGHP